MVYYETSATGYFHVISSLAIVLCFIHGVSVLLSISNYLYSESLQYKRLCECAIFSTLIILTLLVITIVNVQKDKYTDAFYADINARLTNYLLIYSFFSSQMFHVMGMPPSTTGVLITWSLVSWIIVLIHLKYNFVYILFIIVVLLSSVFVFVSQENDSRISHEDKYINQSGEVVKSNTSDSYNTSAIVPCLYLLNETIKDNYTTLTNIGVIEGNVDGATWRWNRTLALLHNSQLLSNSVSSALVKMFKSTAGSDEFYSLNQLISRLFGMFESIYGHNLALFMDYTNVVATQKHISGHREVLELIIFLIIQNVYTFGYNETIKQYPIVMVQCNQVNNLDYIVFHVISLDSRKNEMFSDGLHKDSLLEMSPLLQLANRISSMYLGCTIYFTEPKYSAGIKEIVINIPLNSPEITVTTKVTGVGMQMESLINPTWLFIEDQKLSSMSMDTLKSKFNLLRVPVTQCLAHNLVKITEKYSVALISEDLLAQHLDQFKSELGDIALHLVVVCKNPSSPSDIFSNYKLKVSACLSVESMVSDVYNCIMYLCAQQQPRVVVGSDDFSVLFNNHLSGFTSLFKKSTDNLNANSSSISRQNDVKANKKMRMIKALENRLLCNKLLIICNNFVTEIQVHLPSISQQLVLINHIIDECKERIQRSETDVSAYDEYRNKYLLRLIEKNLDSDSSARDGTEMDNESDSIYFLLPNERTRVAFYIYNTFVPMIISIKKTFYQIQLKGGKVGDVSEYVSIKSTLTGYSARANTYKLHLLNTLLLTLHDLIGIVHTYMISNESQTSQLLASSHKLLIQVCQVTELYLVTYIENSI